MIKNTIRAAAAATLALSLGGCVSLFPKSDPAQTYRFGVETATPSTTATVTQASPADAFGVLKARTGFARASAGDQILTVTLDGETAYIGGARWVTPAIVLFDEAIERAFDADQGPARLISRGEVGRSELMLKMDVRAFEAVYVDGVDSAPEVKVEVRALITRNLDRSLVSDQVFTARVRAADNRVGAIAQAFDQAVAQTLGQVVETVNAAAPAAKSAPAALGASAETPAAAPTTPVGPPSQTAPANAR